MVRLKYMKDSQTSVIDQEFTVSDFIDHITDRYKEFKIIFDDNMQTKEICDFDYIEFLVSSESKDQ